MKKDIYHELLIFLGKVGVGFPYNKKFVSILRDNITVAEAEVAMGLPIRLPPLEVESLKIIARRLNKPVEIVKEHLETLSQKGFLVKKELESGSVGYAFIQGGFGIPQMFYWNGAPNSRVKKNAMDLLMYMKSGSEELKAQGDAKQFRYIPVSQSLSRIEKVVMPYDDLIGMVKKTRRVALVHCACREQMNILKNESTIFAKIFANYIWGKKGECTHTRENCLKFDDMADYILEKGLGKEISMERAIEIINDTEKEGLVHFVDNCVDGLHHLCNCCSCCCWQMRLISNGWAKRDDIMATYYVRDTKNAKCVGCGLCVKDCPLNIISMDNKLPIINTDKCLGCGLCVRRCPTKAAILKNRTDKIPYESFSKLHSTAIKRVIATEKH